MPSNPPPNQDLVISYRRVRQLLGYVAIGMPFVLASGAWLVERIPWADSVSAYYYTSMRDVFVGTMFAIGVFLVCYRGYDRVDNWLTNSAGVAAAAIGLFPMETHYSKVLLERHRDIAGPNCYVPLWLPGYHFYSAAIFFALISGLVLFRFTRSDQAVMTIRKRARNRVYIVCGLIMVGCFIWIGLLKWRSPAGSITVPETGAIVAFAIAWLTKGEAILPD
jgi:hypothetical protein